MNLVESKTERRVLVCATLFFAAMFSTTITEVNAATGAWAASARSLSKVRTEFGPDVPPVIAARVQSLINAADPTTPLILSFGETKNAQNLIGARELPALGTEGFIIRTRTTSETTTIAVRAPPARR